MQTRRDIQRDGPDYGHDPGSGDGGPIETIGSAFDSVPLERRISLLAAVSTIVIVLLGMRGWNQEPEFFDALRQFSVLMSPVTAISLIVLAGVLLVLTRRALSAVSLTFLGSMVVLVFVFDVADIVAYLAGIDLRFEYALAPHTLVTGEQQLVRMATTSEVTCLLAGIAILTLIARRAGYGMRLGHLAGGLGSLVLVIGFVFCLVCLWQSPLLYGPKSTPPMTLTTSLSFLTLGLAVIGNAGATAIPLCLLASVARRDGVLNERKALLVMTLIMVSASAAVMAIMAVVLYRHEIEQHKSLLQLTMRSQVMMISGAVRHDDQLAGMAMDGNLDAAITGEVLNRLLDEYERTVGLDQSVEITLARRVNDSIVFVVRRRSVSEDPTSVAFDSDLAEPMRKALSERPGTVVGLDYRGDRVLAAYGSIDLLDLGIVAKTRLADTYTPLIRSVISAGAVALVLVLTGTSLFYWVGTPIISRLEAQARQLKAEVAQRRQSEGRLRGFMESASEGFIILDSDLRFFSVNQVAQGLFAAGHTVDNLRGKHILEIVPEFEKSGMYEAFVQVVKTGKPMYSDGNLAGCQFAGKHFSLNAFNTGSGMGIVFSDITEQKRIERQIRAKELRFRTVFEQSNACNMLLDPNAPDGIPTVEDANQAACDAHGYSREEMIGRSVADLVDGDGERIFAQRTHKILSGETLRVELTHLRSDGVPFRMSILATAIRIPGEPSLIFTTEFDITERRQMLEELERHRGRLEQLVQERTVELNDRVAEAEGLNSAMANVLEDLQVSNAKLEAAHRELTASNKELDAFSYTISHDLRAPLRHISGFLSLLMAREKDRLDATSSHYLETIAASAERMGRLIDDLLGLSRTSRAELSLRYVDSNQVVRATREELASLAQGRQIKWTIDDLPIVQADAGLLRQVWQNLLGNAIKYTGTREDAHIEIGRIREGAEEGSDEIVFFVRDNGVGFDPQYASKMFGVFQRLHRNDEFEGTGIGLATVHRILNRLGGRIWAEGALGQGATFYFTLKAARNTESEGKTNLTR
jgi:PAS domain S-box-containing protein